MENTSTTTPAVTEPNASGPALRSIFMYRRINGTLVRWKFEVDNQMLIYREGPADPTAMVGTSNATDTPQRRHDHALEGHKRNLDARGIKYVINDAGQIVVTHVPAKEKFITEFLDIKREAVDNITAPLLQLRTKYIAEVNASGGATCPGCMLSGIQRKYRESMNTSGLLSAFEEKT